MWSAHQQECLKYLGFDARLWQTAGKSLARQSKSEVVAEQAAVLSAVYQELAEELVAESTTPNSKPEAFAPVHTAESVPTVPAINNATNHDTQIAADGFGDIYSELQALSESTQRAQTLLTKTSLSESSSSLSVMPSGTSFPRTTVTSPVQPIQLSSEASHFAAPNKVISLSPLDDSSAALNWQALQQQFSDCQRCSLCVWRQQHGSESVPANDGLSTLSTELPTDTRTRSIDDISAGSSQAEILLILPPANSLAYTHGEWLSAAEQALLNGMLNSIGLNVSQIHYTSVVKGLLPHNRDPLTSELEACQPYWQQACELLRPSVILLVGRVAAHTVLQCQSKLSSLLDHTFRLEFSDGSAPALVLPELDYLLRTPSEKQLAWRQLKKLAYLRAHWTEPDAELDGESNTDDTHFDVNANKLGTTNNGVTDTLSNIVINVAVND